MESGTWTAMAILLVAALCCIGGAEGVRCKKDGCSLYCNGTGMHSFVCEYQDWTVVNLFLNDNDLTELAVDDIRDCYENVRYINAVHNFRLDSVKCSEEKGRVALIWTCVYEFCRPGLCCCGNIYSDPPECHLFQGEFDLYGLRKGTTPATSDPIRTGAPTPVSVEPTTTLRKRRPITTSTGRASTAATPSWTTSPAPTDSSPPTAAATVSSHWSKPTTSPPNTAGASLWIIAGSFVGVGVLLGTALVCWRTLHTSSGHQHPGPRPDIELQPIPSSEPAEAQRIESEEPEEYNPFLDDWSDTYSGASNSTDSPPPPADLAPPVRTMELTRFVMVEVFGEEQATRAMLEERREKEIKEAARKFLTTPLKDDPFSSLPFPPEYDDPNTPSSSAAGCRQLPSLTRTLQAAIEEGALMGATEDYDFLPSPTYEVPRSMTVPRPSPIRGIPRSVLEQPIQRGMTADESLRSGVAQRRLRNILLEYGLPCENVLGGPYSAMPPINEYENENGSSTVSAVVAEREISPEGDYEEIPDDVPEEEDGGQDYDDVDEGDENE